MPRYDGDIFWQALSFSVQLLFVEPVRLFLTFQWSTKLQRLLTRCYRHLVSKLDILKAHSSSQNPQAGLTWNSNKSGKVPQEISCSQPKSIKARADDGEAAQAHDRDNRKCFVPFIWQ